MNKKISDILIISDLDNTLLNAKSGIPNFNIEMINKFTELGGKFTVATGRSTESVAHYVDNIKLTTPAIVYNGAIIYDYNSKVILSKTVLPKSTSKILNIIMNNFKDVGIEIMCDNYRLYIIQENEYTHQHVSDENLSYINADLENITNNWIKVLFADKNENLLMLKQFCEDMNDDSVEFVMTNDIYFEIMPKDVSKGKALKKLCELVDIDIENTIAIGDYYNDIEILKTAGLSACVANAPDEIKDICNAIVPSCMEGGVGHLISQVILSCGLNI